MRCDDGDKLKKQFGRTGRRLPSTRGIRCKPAVDLVETNYVGDVKSSLAFIEQP
jgi:hypothetical protein